MDGLNLNNQLYEKTQLLISKMEKEIELKDSEIYSKTMKLNQRTKKFKILKLN
ncbi:hypothetical protein [Clostridium sp. ZBS2]|uniref:hypothetical protein n=1 Tax=Clostridium sp. ZBS2 TaxID=2949976 RepID=UPI00207A43E4|nr:hypothetical protein [Clostridium sp. ZBS2]